MYKLDIHDKYNNSNSNISNNNFIIFKEIFRRKRKIFVIMFKFNMIKLYKMDAIMYCKTKNKTKRLKLLKIRFKFYFCKFSIPKSK